MEDLYRTIEDYNTAIKGRIAKLESLKQDLISGNLKTLKLNGKEYFYRREPGRGGKAHYIHLNDHSTLKAMAMKKYINDTVKILKANLIAAEAFLAKHSRTEEEYYAANFQERLKPFVNDIAKFKSIEIEKWQNNNYKRNESFPEDLIHSTIRGEKVRSKSEVIIANALFAAGVPYKIETPIHIKRNTFYPDFVILNKNTMEEIYWEHFGMMSDREYAENTCRKIKLYADDGILLGKNLICTFESQNVPLSSSIVQYNIETFCL